MKKAAQLAGVQVVTGDTKVVDKGKADGLFINTSGIGVVEVSHPVSPRNVNPGDKVILSGDVGRHGVAIMAVREGLDFESKIETDCAPLADMVMQLIEAGVSLHCLRDLTRGGMATALVEIARSAKVRIHIDERQVPVTEEVRGACEMLGLDPLYVANEGRFVAFVPAAEAEHALSILRAHPLGRGATLAGEVVERDDRGAVTLGSVIGSTRILDMLTGEQLPRIC